MREILFRGKRKSNGEWIEGFYFEKRNPCSEDGKPVRYCISDVPPFGADILPETLGQFTGLYDKNGTKIFEGDIVEFTSPDYMGISERGEVIFKDGCYGVSYVSEFSRKLKSRHRYEYFHRIGQIDKWQDMGASGTITYTYEVLGDVWDSPELLEGERE